MTNFSEVKGIVFDKDGTLFDFNLSWADWAQRIITILSEKNNVAVIELADILGFDLKKKRFRAGSNFIAGTLAETVRKLTNALKNETEASLENFLLWEATNQTQSAVTSLIPTLLTLKKHNFVLGVATNDAESAAIAHLKKANIYKYFDFLAGYDSGYGSKPDPGQINAFCTKMKLEPNEVVMIGDSTHDLAASLSAGTIPIGVLTGPATKSELEPYSSIILNSIRNLVDLFELKATTDVENL